MIFCRNLIDCNWLMPWRPRRRGIIKHRRWWLLLREQAILLTNKRIEETNSYLACSYVGYRYHNVCGRASEQDSRWRLSCPSFYPFKDNLVEVWLLSFRNAFMDIYMQEIKLRWFLELTSSLMSNLYFLSDASTQ